MPTCRAARSDQQHCITFALTPKQQGLQHGQVFNTVSLTLVRFLLSMHACICSDPETLMLGGVLGKVL